MIIGLGDGENYLASDIPAFLDRTRNVIFLEDGEMAVLTSSKVHMYALDTGRLVEHQTNQISWDIAAAEKGGYPYFTLKEILEQPAAMQNTLAGRIANSLPNLAELQGIDTGRIRQVHTIGCSTSYYAGLFGKLAIQNWAKLPAEVQIASEFRYTMPVLDESNLCVLISQSGETADVLATSHIAKEGNAQQLAVCNVMGSSLTRQVDATLYLRVGPEISVIATKSFTAQVVLQYLLALQLGLERGTVDRQTATTLVRALEYLPDQIEEMLSQSDAIAELARQYTDRQSFFFIGRVYGLPTALEGAMKLKEQSYIHAEGLPAGELKHGHLALVDKTTPIVAIAHQSATYEKVVSNMQEVRARGAEVIAVANEGDREIQRHADHVIYIPSAPEPISALLGIVPLQLFAYHVTLALGRNPDTPRNLAKSVTVE